MNRVVFGVFAHPDDEAFGPCATLYKLAQNGAEVHLICVTDGGAEAGEVQTRRHEWQNAGKIIGARHMHQLDYSDGKLCNSLYHEVAHKIIQLVRQSCQDGPVEVSFITFDPNGLTGHLDHVAVSYITTYVFYQLCKAPPSGATIKELAYYCHSLKQQPAPDLDYFVFWPAGREPGYINRVVDGSGCLDIKRLAISAHQSQSKDIASAFKHGEDWLAIENFHVVPNSLAS